MRAAQRNYAAVYPPGHVYHALAGTALGAALGTLGRHDEAQRLLRDSGARLAEYYGDASHRVAKSRERLAALATTAPD